MLRGGKPSCGLFANGLAWVGLQAGRACCSLSRLWTVQMRRHSLFTAGMLRRLNRR